MNKSEFKEAIRQTTVRIRDRKPTLKEVLFEDIDRLEKVRKDILKHGISLDMYFHVSEQGVCIGRYTVNKKSYIDIICGSIEVMIPVEYQGSEDSHWAECKYKFGDALKYLPNSCDRDFPYTEADSADELKKFFSDIDENEWLKISEDINDSYLEFRLDNSFQRDYVPYSEDFEDEEDQE